MPDLLMRTALTTVEQAMKNQLLLAYGTRIKPAAADVPTLRAFASAGLSPDELYFVTAKGVTYQWSRTSTAADDGDTTIQPNDAPTAGRWLKTSSTTATGYAKAVRIHTGQDEYLAMLRRGYSVRPSMHIVFDSVNYRDMSQSRGALLWCKARYRVVAISSSLRQGAQVVEGSDVPAEFANDPGTHDMIGDIAASLAGSNINTTGVDRIDIDDEHYKTSELAGRLFAEEMALTVLYTVQQPDAGLTTLDALSGMSVQRQLLGGTQPLDLKNYVSSGYTVPTGGLTAAVAAGTAVIAGATVSSTPSSRTWAASSDTYRDLQPSGAFVYTAVANGSPAPAVQGTGALRVGVTVTSASAIVLDAMLAPAIANLGSSVDWLAAAGVPTSIAISPSSASSARGTAVKFTCTATYSNQSTRDVSTLVAWSSSAPSVATLDYTGTASVVGAGSTSITCTLGTLSASPATLTGT